MFLTIRLIRALRGRVGTHIAIQMIAILLGATPGSPLSWPSTILSAASLIACLLLAAAVEIVRVDFVLVEITLILAIVSIKDRLASIFIEGLGKLLVFQKKLVRLVLVQEEQGYREELTKDVENEQEDTPRLAKERDSYHG